MSAPLSLADAVIRLQCGIHKAGSQKAFADAAGVSESLVSASLHGRMSPSVAAAIGLTPVTVYITTPTTPTQKGRVGG